MRNIALFTATFCLCFVCQSFSQSWVESIDNFGLFKFKTPGIPAKIAQGSSLMYNFESSVALLYQVHYQDSAKLDLSVVSDPYEFFVQTLLYETGGTLESYGAVSFLPSSIQGKEIGISYFDSSNIKYYLFARVFMSSDHLWSFSISAKASLLSALLSSKNQYFNSIVKL
jgi:hypothetical protein